MCFLTGLLKTLIFNLIKSFFALSSQLRSSTIFLNWMFDFFSTNIFVWLFSFIISVSSINFSLTPWTVFLISLNYLYSLIIHWFYSQSFLWVNPNLNWCSFIGFLFLGSIAWDLLCSFGASHYSLFKIILVFLHWQWSISHVNYIVKFLSKRLSSNNWSIS